MRKGIGGHHRPHNGVSHEWFTPPEILQALGPFDDDPCQPGSTDGLVRAWHGFVWLNPPYGPHVGKWLLRLADHHNGIAIVFARTETQWFFDHVWESANGLLFLKGRIHFYRNGQRAKHNSGGPSVLVGYGKCAVNRLTNCQLPGYYIALRHAWL